MVLILSLVLGSCSQGDKTIDELVIAFDNTPRSFDPRFALDANSQYLTNLIHCSLIEYTADGGHDLQAAKEITWKEGNKLYITLKDKVEFSHHKPLTAHDVKATFDYFLQKPALTPRAASFKNVEKIEVLASDQLVFIFKKPDASFVVNNLGIGILPRELAGKKHIKEASEIIGCGPYQLEKFSSHEIKLKKNQQFFIKERVPKKNELMIKIVKDEGTRFLKLQKGEIHLSQNISREKVGRIKDYPNLEVVKKVGLNTAYLAFNMKDPVVGNVKVREAIAYAIDRDQIIKYVLYNMAKKANSLLTPSSEYYHAPSKKRELNLEKAKKLLDEAGYPHINNEPHKPRLVLKYKTTTDRTRVTIAKTIVTQLAQIGIKVELQTLEWGKFKKDIEAGKAQMWSLQWVGFKDPDILHYAFHSSHFAPMGGNRGFYHNKELDQLLEKARSVVDKKERKKLYFKAQEILNKELPYINLWHEEVFAVMRKSLTGYQVYADGRYQALPLVREK